MTVYKEYRVGNGNSPFGFFVPLIILAIFFATLYFLARGIFWLFSYLAPVFLIATLIIDYKVIVDFFKFIWKLLKEKTLFGIAAVVLTIFGYPFVSAYLFFKALSSRTIKNVQKKMEEEQNTFTEFEEVVDEDTTFLELPPLNSKKRENSKQQAKPSEYDDMFK